MELKINGAPGGSGMWEAVKVAIQGGWPTTTRLAVLLILIYLLCSEATHLVVAAVADALGRHGAEHVRAQQAASRSP